MYGAVSVSPRSKDVDRKLHLPRLAASFFGPSPESLIPLGSVIRRGHVTIPA
jgi:hypothetical protein